MKGENDNQIKCINIPITIKIKHYFHPSLIFIVFDKIHVIKSHYRITQYFLVYCDKIENMFYINTKQEK